MDSLVLENGPIDWSAVLDDAKQKHGEVIARLEDDQLSFERPRLRDQQYDEIVLSAMAVAEAARRAERDGKAAIMCAPGDATGTMAGD